MSEHAIYDRLRTLTELGATTTDPNGGRIYPMVLPQGVEYPAATYQRITTTRYPAFGRDAQAVEPVIQIDVYGEHESGYLAFATVANAVLTSLHRYRNLTATPPIYDTFIDAQRDDYEENTKLFRRSYDIRPWYRET